MSPHFRAGAWARRRLRVNPDCGQAEGLGLQGCPGDAPGWGGGRGGSRTERGRMPGRSPGTPGTSPTCLGELWAPGGPANAHG